MKTLSTKERIAKELPELKKELRVSNALAVPRLSKVVVSSGTGRAKSKERNELVNKRLTLITGQKPAPRGAKKSIASFKLREGDIIGYQVTLRGERMYGFLDKLLNVALPRTKDFKGIPETAVDAMGNLSIGIREHTIFPETGDEDVRDIFGLAITLVTTAQSREQAIPFFRAIGVPFKK